MLRKIKSRAAVATITALAVLASLAAFTATATAYSSVEHGKTIIYKQLVPGNSGWTPVTLKEGRTD